MHKFSVLKKNESGFTLAEMLVVFAIMAAMMLALLPKISRWLGRNELLGVARRVSNDFQFCRQQAIASSNDCTITLTSSIPISYTLAYTKSGAATSQTTTVSESASFQSISASTFHFDYRGMASSSVTVAITNGNDEVRTVAVSLAGKITMS